jgi:hypothetical protein
MMDITHFKMAVDAQPISMAEIGWTEHRDDNQIKRYIKQYIKKNYGYDITEDVALVFAMILWDVAEDEKKLGVKKERERILTKWEEIKRREYFSGGSLTMDKAFLDIKKEIEKG